MGTSSRVGWVTGNGYPDNWCFEACGLEGGMEIGGNGGPWGNCTGIGKEGDWETGGGVSKG